MPEHCSQMCEVTPSTSAELGPFPAWHSAHVVCCALTTRGRSHNKHVSPSSEYRPVAQSTHCDLLLSGADPAEQAVHCSPLLTAPALQGSQAVLAVFGFDPTGHGMHVPPSELNPLWHVVQPLASSFACWPGAHVSHDCISRAPPVSSLWRCVPPMHATQVVAPTPSWMMFASSPSGQNSQLRPTSDIFPGGHTSHAA